MESPGEPAAPFHLYSLLPYELRLGIIESWLRDRDATYWFGHCMSRGRIAKYATVDRQWKSVIEKYTFGCLTLQFDEIHSLERVCVEDRICAFSQLHLNVILDKISSGRTESSTTVTHSTTNGSSSTHFNTDQSLINTKSVEAAENLIPILERFQESGLKVLDIAVLSTDMFPLNTTMGTEPELYTPPSIRLSQAMVAMTCRLEQLSLMNVVDVPYFLKGLCGANANTLRNPSTWPHLKYLVLYGYTTIQPPDFGASAAELYDAVTGALPCMPNITWLGITMRYPSYVHGRRHWDNVVVDMRIAPRLDSSALRDGQLFLQGPEPDPATIDKWKEVTKRHWHCKLRPVDTRRDVI